MCHKNNHDIYKSEYNYLAVTTNITEYPKDIILRVLLFERLIQHFILSSRAIVIAMVIAVK